MAQTLGTLLIDVKADTQQLIKGFDRAEKAVNKTTKTMTNSVKLLTSAFIGLGAVDIAKTLSRQADTMTNINSKLKLVTTSTEELTKAQNELFKIAQKTRTGFADNVDLYQKISLSTQNLGLSQKEILSLTESINKSLVISGTSAEGATTLITQLGQAFANDFKGVGQELGTIRDQSTALYQAILKGAGLTEAQFRKMAQDGELSSKLIAEAVFKQEQALDQNFKKMAKTVSQSYTQIENSTIQLIGNLDKISGASEAVSKTFTTISESLEGISQKDIENFATIAQVVGGLGASYLALNVVSKAYVTTSNLVIATNAILGGSFGAVNRAIVLTTVATKALQKALKFSALGVATGSIYLLVESFIEATKRADSFKWSVRDLNSELALVPFKQRLAEVTKQIAEMDERLKGYNDTQKMAFGGGYNVLYREKRQLEKNIALIEEKNKAIANTPTAPTSNTATTPTNTFKIEETALKEYYLKLGKFQKAWEIESAELSKKFGAEKWSEIAGIYKREFLDKFTAKEEKQKELFTPPTTSLSSWENYYKTIGDLSTAWLIKEAQLREQYIDLTEEQFKKVANIAKSEYFDNLEEFSFELNVDSSGFDGISKALISTSNAFGDLGKEQEAFNKFTKEYAKIQEPTLKDKEKFNKAEKQHIKNQLNGYSGIAGAIGGLYAKGSREASAFQAIQAGIALTEGITAVLSAGKGDPYSAPARMAAMAGTVASLLSNAKIAFGFGGIKTTTTSDAFSAQAENLGAGTTLGDSSKASESITNSLETLEDFAQPQYQVLTQMNKSLSTISDRIGGVASLLIRQGGFAFGAGAVQFSSSKQNLKLNDTLANLIAGGPINAILGELKIPIVSDIANFLGGVVNSVLGGLFGKTSVSQSLKDYGINFNEVLLTSAIEQISGQAFQTIATTVTKKSWFKKSSSTTIRTYFKALDEETERQFSLVLNDLYNTTILAGQALDASSADIENSLSNFVVKIGKISTKGKTGEEIQEQIANIFSKIGDDIATTAFPQLDEFQQVGEGMFETLTRVATGMQEAEFFIKRLGGTFEDINFKDIINKQGDIGFEALLQSIVKADEALFGFDNGVVKILETLGGTAEELFTTYNTLEDVRVNLELTGQSAKNLSSSMIVGAGSISSLADATNEYFENFLTEEEQLQSKTQQLNKEFLNLNQTMPTSVKGFKDLIGSIDTSTDSGAELFGRLISLSEGFADVFGSIADVEKLRQSFIGLGESINKTIDSLIGGTNKAQQQTNQIELFWKKRNEADALIAKNATLTSAEQTRLNSLVGEINALAGTIQSGSIGNTSIITQELIGSLTELENSLDLENDILKVNIVGINDNVNLLSGTERSVPNITNTINPSVPLGDSKDTLNAILDKITTMRDDIKDMLDNSNAFINGYAIPKVEVAE